MTQQKEGDYIFDGFMHRGYDETVDGWRNEMPDEMEFPVLGFVEQIREMGLEIATLRKENWQLRQRLEVHQ